MAVQARRRFLQTIGHPATGRWLPDDVGRVAICSRRRQGSQQLQNPSLISLGLSEFREIVAVPREGLESEPNQPTAPRDSQRVLPAMSSRYQESISRQNPLLVLFLVDQSSSMAELFDGQPGLSKAEFIAAGINRLTYNLILRCSIDREIVDRVHFGLIAYNSEVQVGFGPKFANRHHVPASELAANPLRVESRIQTPLGDSTATTPKFPVWIDPEAQGQTCMRQALHLAQISAVDFLAKYPESFPPIVINLTGGVPTDALQADFADVIAAADLLKETANAHGSQVLLFNICVAAERTTSIHYPNSEAQVAGKLQKLLFRMSSSLQDFEGRQPNRVGVPISAGARALHVQSEPAAVFDLIDLDIGTQAIIGGDRDPSFPPSSASSRPPPQRETILDENVQFTVYRPQSIRPERWYPLLAYAHLDALPKDAPPEEVEPLEAVKADAIRTLGDQIRRFANVTQDSTHAVPREGELTFVPDIPGAECNPARQSIRWMEQYHRVEFRVRASADSAGQVLRGRLSVFLGAILLADVPLRLQVNSLADPHDRRVRIETATASRYRKIFASYSHRDLAIVEQFEKYVETLGDRYLRDWRELRSGERWNDRLMQMIEEADVFQLFWSHNSMHSSFVRQEWEHALKLKHKGPSFIRPTYWEEPFPESAEQRLPPSELKDIQFTRLGISVSQPVLNEVGGLGRLKVESPLGREVALKIDHTRPSPPRDQARESRRVLAQQLLAAHAACDMDRALLLRDEWKRQDLIVPAADAESNELEAVFAWIEHEANQRRAAQQHQTALAELKEALDAGASRDELQQRRAAVERQGPLPSEIARKLEVRTQSLERHSRRTAMFAILPLLLVGCLTAAFAWIFFSRRSAEFREQVAHLQGLIEGGNKAQAEAYVQQLQATSPASLEKPQMRQLLAELERLKSAP